MLPEEKVNEQPAEALETERSDEDDAKVAFVFESLDTRLMKCADRDYAEAKAREERQSKEQDSVRPPRFFRQHEWRLYDACWGDEKTKAVRGVRFEVSGINKLQAPMAGLWE